MSIDPVIYSSLQFFLSLIFTVGGIQKLVEIDKFESVLFGYQLLPAWLVPMFAIALPAFEVIAGFMVAIGFQLSLGVDSMIVILAAVTGAVVINLLRGNLDIKCGCGGISDSSKISWAIPARNAFLLSAAVLLKLNMVERDLGLFDRVTSVLLTLSLVGLYVIANQLITNTPLLNSLRRAK